MNAEMCIIKDADNCEIIVIANHGTDTLGGLGNALVGRCNDVFGLVAASGQFANMA